MRGGPGKAARARKRRSLIWGMRGRQLPQIKIKIHEGKCQIVSRGVVAVASRVRKE